MKPWLWILLAATLSGLAPAQQLRRGVAAADRVVVARPVASEPRGDHLVLHRLQVLATLAGDPADSLVVVEVAGVSLHARPVPDQTRLYCLHDRSRAAVEAGLPEAGGPYFKMNGHAGANPRLDGDLEGSPVLAFARIVIDAERGASPRESAYALVDLVLRGTPEVRAEAVAMLTERPVLRSRLTPVHWGEMLARTAGETDDIPFKTSLALLCAEQGLDGLVDALCLSLVQIEDPVFAQTVGRIARRLHGEGAFDVLRPHLLRAPQSQRGPLLLALGATATESALDALLRMRRLGPDPFVDAALRQHGSPRARAALEGGGR